MKQEKIGVIGLGYVGLPLALGFARYFEGVVGFDLSAKRVASLLKSEDFNSEVSQEELKAHKLKITSDPSDLKGVTLFVVAVPTPVDADKRPDLTPIEAACETVGKVMSKGAVVVFESTVYPGVTEEICGPLLEKSSGLKQSQDFKLGFSPERINPGDREHTLETIKKIVSAEDAESLARVEAAYAPVVTAGLHKAGSIKVAEAAKVIENTQRDLNIALMNELAIIFDRMGISSREVFEAAATKWNFIRFSPGLVGGHCIGVDPYYLTTKAEKLGYHPQVILAGRRINDDMGVFIAQRMVKLMVTAGIQVKGARIGILGLTFKENVSDLRNSRVPDIARELRDFGLEVLVHDPLALPADAHEEYGIKLVRWDELSNLDGIVLAVSHRHYLEMGAKTLCAGLKKGAVFVDVKSIVDRKALPEGVHYWSL